MKRKAAIAVGLLIACAGGAGFVQSKSLLSLVKIRSDNSMCLESLSPYLRRLPSKATLLVIDYKDIGLNILDVMRLPDSEKALTQRPMLPIHHAAAWIKVLGREDINVEPFTQYRDNPAWRKQHSTVFVWLMNSADLKYINRLNLHSSTLAFVQRGAGEMRLMELSGQPRL